jgi:protein-S-isoprenylcysteine O-methyltransferase Ste14
MVTYLSSPWIAKAVVIAASIALIAIPATIHKDTPKIIAVESRKGLLERCLLVLTSCAFLLTLVWLVTPLFAFANDSRPWWMVFAGVLLVVLGLWLLARSHADLGKNWSITLELREHHELVCHGIYRRIRHPMYLSLLLYSAGQALVIPNWIAGPAYFVALVMLFGCRIGPEENMMTQRFGQSYQSYAARTKRLMPGIW